MTRFSTTAVGTLPWLAPEILRGQAYGLAADVYSFGIVMWEVATRELPYMDIEDDDGVRSQVVAGRRPNMGNMGEEVTTEYLHLMQRCLDARDTQRPSCAVVVNTIRSMPGHMPRPLPRNASGSSLTASYDTGLSSSLGSPYGGTPKGWGSDVETMRSHSSQ